MNIKEAKEEMIRTIRAYQRKDETGAYEIPFEQQRPILLIGPPGIGKTAVMEQIAEECGIGLVAYTITHHTRQSAIGLPMISHRSFGGKEQAVTEYTMSEIVASVYQKIEQTGVQEGILFLDEINCVSETLAPTMLQFLQYKTFGTHHVPDGWIIVTAGNQPQYNRSAREFDIVTLDRVKKMEIEADFSVWKEYAVANHVHGSILSYLNIKKQHFYVIRTEVDGRHFVTARGWEDLSRMIFAYEAMGEPVTEKMTVQYLQDAQIARDFAVYYDLYRKYSEVYRIDDIIAGKYLPDPAALQEIPFDEKFSLIRLLADGVHRDFAAYNEQTAVQENLYGMLAEMKYPIYENDGVSFLNRKGSALYEELERKQDAGMISREAARILRLTAAALKELGDLLPADAGSSSGNKEKSSFEYARVWFSAREDAREKCGLETECELANIFAFLEHVYGAGHEMVMLMTELNADRECLRFVNSHGSAAYDRYNKMLLLKDRDDSLRQEIIKLTL